MARIDYSMMIKPISGSPFCGDITWAKKFNNQLYLCLIDVAGHGQLAQDLAEESVQLLNERFNNNLLDIIFEFDKNFKGTRGLVMGICLIEINTGLVNYIGIGNVRMRIIGRQGYRFVSHAGVLGLSKPRPILQQYLLNDQDVLLMYSDGITDRFEKRDYPDIIIDPIESIPEKIITLFSKNMDDTSCIAARYFYD